MRRLLWLWGLVLFLLFTGLGVGTFHLWQHQALQHHLEAHERIVTQASVIFSREIGHIEQMMRFLKTDQEQLDPRHYPNLKAWQRDVSEHFQRFSLISPHISQLRWLSVTGQEQVRSNITQGQVVPVTEAQLQDKSSRDYVREGMQTPYGQIYISPIDLNIERGEFVVPYEATLRAVTKLRSSTGKPMGLMVLNYNLNRLLQRFKQLSVAPYSLEMMNTQGQWLIANDPRDAWQHMFGDYLGSFPNRYPNAWRRLKDNEQVLQAVYLDNSGPAIIQPTSFDESQLNRPSSERYYFLARLQPSIWQQESVQRAWTVAVISVLSYGLALLLIYYLGRFWQQRRRYIQRIEQDKTRLEEMYQSLAQANANLVTLQDELVEQNRMSALGMLVAGVGHELNTPLGGIRMSLSTMAHIIKQLAKDNPTQAGLLKDTLEIADQNLTRGIDTVAQFKRITEQRMHQDKVSFDVHDMVQDMLTPLKQVFKHYPSVVVQNQIAPGQQWTSTPGVLSQVLQNLVMNAMEHAFKPGQSGVITLTASIEDEYVIEVADNGQGIPNELVATIWDPFVTTGRSHKHTGLGLYMVHQWVHNLLGGDVAVVTSEQGTRFTISVPIPQSESAY